MRINEAKKPSGVDLKSKSRKVTNQYITGDIYDFHSPMESKEDTYVDHDGNGYIMDKTGREYPVKASISQGDAGRIAGGSTHYYVTIYFPGIAGKDGKEAYYRVEGYQAIFSNGSNTGCVSDIQNGYYLEDYIAKYGKTYDSNLPDELYDELVSRADADAKSYATQKAERSKEKQAAFDKQYRGLNGSGIFCEIKDGNVIAKALRYYNDETKDYDEYEAPKNILDKATALFEINGYTFKDFEGATFTARPKVDYGIDVRYDTKTGEIVAFEKHGSRTSKVDFDRVGVKIENIKIDKTSPFGKLIMKTVSDKAGTQSAFITTSNIAKQINKIWGRGDSSWGTGTGYDDTAFGLGTPESEMRHIRANVRRHAIEELKAEFAKMKNPDSFTYAALKEVIELLPKKELANEYTGAAVEKPAEKVSATEVKSNPVAVQKMTAWHNGERKQNVGACSDAKLKMYYKTCKDLGFEPEMEVLKAEAEKRGLLLENAKRKTEAWNYRHGLVPNEGNGRVGGKWYSADKVIEFEKTVDVEFNGEDYSVVLTGTAELSCGEDDSVDYSWQEVGVDEDSIQAIDVTKDGIEEANLGDIKDVVIDLAKKQLIAEKDDYFAEDWLDEE